MLIYHDPRFRYPWFWEATGVCDLKVYNIDSLITPVVNQIAIVSDLVLTTGESANDGPSITNAFEWIATKVRTELGIIPNIWVEFYPDRGYRLAERKAKGWPADFRENFAIVTLAWAKSLHWKMPGKCYQTPEWNHVDRAYVEALLVEPFPYEYCTRKVE